MTGATVQAARAQDYDAEARQLAEQPAIRAAFEAILELEPRTRVDHIALTEIPAPPFQEERRAQRYSQMLQAAGSVEVEIDEVGNVIARRRGTKGERVVALAAHMDTVFPEGTDVTVRVEGNKFTAPGIGDDTRGLIVVLTALRAMNRASIETEADLLFIGTVGEEGLGDLRGAKHLFRDNGLNIDSWIAVDGGGLDRVVHQGIGSIRYRVTFKGPGGHSWGAFGLANPAHALARAIHTFDEEASGYVAKGPRTSYNIGRIGGGTSVNSIPFESWLEVDMRSVSPEQLEGINRLFRNAVTKAVDEQNKIRRNGDPVTAELEMVGNRPSGSIDPSTPIIQRAMATTRLFGIEPSLGTGSTDSNVPIARGIPAVTIGRGGEGDGAHSLREWWADVDGYLAIQRALLLAVSEAGLHH
jgi:acetylornithine deacetylase/succinyl-diaminopimelate desuccinylase-like protein